MDINSYLNERKDLIDSFLESYFLRSVRPPVLHHSVTYSLSAGGKRIRPVLCLASYEACGGAGRDVVPYAAALELIHTYSLIHDDLPAMDDDDLRRGKPTNHKVFGEGMAILAGDALLTEAFYLIADAHSPSPPLLREGEGGSGRQAGSPIPDSAILRVVKEISRASGMHGMVGGQAQDLLAEDAAPDAETLAFIHLHKTAALITASVRIGGILASCSENALDSLTAYGENIGLAFQVTDDILDIEGVTEVLGKTKGSDEKKKKMTYPRLYGIEKSREKAAELIDAAVNALEPFGRDAEPLREIARYLQKRNS